VGCLGVGEAARGGQSIANQGQEWMGIRTPSKRSWFSKQVNRGIELYKREWDDVKGEARGRVNLGLLCTCISVHICVITCYLRIILLCV
jgi:hypothetical protein